MHTRWIETEFDNTIEPFTGAAEADEAEPRQTMVVEVGGRRLEVSLPGGPGARRRRPRRRRGQGQAAQARRRARRPRSSGDAVAAPMQGTIVKIAVEDGQQVEAGELIVVLEAMKMENPVTAHKAGTVTGLAVSRRRDGHPGHRALRAQGLIAGGGRLAEIRVSSAERDDALAALGVHRASGRLSQDEFDLRCRRATQALSRAELEALFDDLPAPHPDLSGAVSPRPPTVVNPEWPGGRSATRASRVMDVIGVLSLLVGLPVAIVLTATLGMWWTFLIVLGVGVVAMVLGVAFMTPSADAGVPPEAPDSDGDTDGGAAGEAAGGAASR